MATPFHHSQSSAKKWGGTVEEYLPIHEWFDDSKQHIADFRHRMLRHHTEGIFECERQFGPYITLSTGETVPVRWIAEQHVKEDFGGHIPTFSDWCRAIKPERWMNIPNRLSKELQEFDKQVGQVQDSTEV